MSVVAALECPRLEAGKELTPASLGHSLYTAEVRLSTIALKSAASSPSARQVGVTGVSLPKRCVAVLDVCAMMLIVLGFDVQWEKLE